MDQEEESGGAAAEAFDAVRGEIALLRRAVERLAVEKADVPDYAVTLGAISRDQRRAAERVDALATTPVLSLTPEAIGAQVQRAAADLRRGEQQILDGARRELEAATKVITGRIASARSRERQFYWLAGASASGVVVGILFVLLLVGPVARTLPATWHLPERIAARLMATSMEQAGQRLMAASDPNLWKLVVANEQMIYSNRRKIAACRQAAEKSGQIIRCVIEMRTS